MARRTSACAEPRACEPGRVLVFAVGLAVVHVLVVGGACFAVSRAVVRRVDARVDARALQSRRFGAM